MKYLYIIAYLLCASTVHATVTYKTFCPEQIAWQKVPNKVLLLYPYDGIKGGTRTYRINLYKELYKKNFPVTFFVINNKSVQDELAHLQLPFYACEIDKKSEDRNTAFLHALEDVCAQDNIAVVNCNTGTDVDIVKALQEKYPVKIVLTMHVNQTPSTRTLKTLDGVIAVSPQIAQSLCNISKKKRLNIKNITWIAPFFEPKRFLEYTPDQTRHEFFKKTFNLELKNFPVLTMVANFLACTEWKDHTTLLHAVAELIHTKKRPVYLMLAGDGPRKKEMLMLAKKLNLSEYVHFLGFTREIPGLLYHSDIKVMASKNEAFCIALLEAGLMKKPLIGTQGTGMQNIILDEHTGLLFKKSDSTDLAHKIERLLDSPELCTQLGQHAYNYILQEFMPETGINKFIDFISFVLSSSPPYQANAGLRPKSAAQT